MKFCSQLRKQELHYPFNDWSHTSNSYILLNFSIYIAWNARNATSFQSLADRTNNYLSFNLWIPTVSPARKRDLTGRGCPSMTFVILFSRLSVVWVKAGTEMLGIAMTEVLWRPPQVASHSKGANSYWQPSVNLASPKSFSLSQLWQAFLSLEEIFPVKAFH